MGGLQKINGQNSGQYQPLSRGTSHAHKPTTLPVKKNFQKHHHTPKASLVMGKPVVSLVTKKVPTHPTLYHHIIHIDESDASSAYWPLGYTPSPPDPELQGVQPLVRIDDTVANSDTSIMLAHERIRREKIVLMWKRKIGSYIGNILQGATQGSPEWRQYELSQFPPGYALFEQQRPPGQKGGDVYLYGSSTVHCFRSPREFQEHALWLMQRGTKPCGCQYCFDGYIPPRARKQISFRV